MEGVRLMLLEKRQKQDEPINVDKLRQASPGSKGPLNVLEWIKLLGMPSIKPQKAYLSNKFPQCIHQMLEPRIDLFFF